MPEDATLRESVGPQVLAAEDFLKSILRSGLLDREQLYQALRTLPKNQLTNADEMANHLVQNGKLSRFQAVKLLEGASRGLMLGPYQIQTPLGKGGMGAVYLALDTRSMHHVAIKVLPPKKAREKARYLTRFQREMELSQRVSHPHIAQSHEVGEDHGVYYIAMEYIPGQSLFRVVNSGGPLAVPRAARLFAEVASALEHAHGLGLIHRDLKPSNIMVTPNDHAKVLDLGLAIIEGEVAEEVEVIGGRGYVVGSVDYIAPEQTEDSTSVDARSDIYAMGCALYFALCGKPPFPGGKTRDKINAHRRRAPEPIQSRNRDVPDGFADVVHKMMAKKPADRYASAADARAALTLWVPLHTEAIRPVETEGDSAQDEAIRFLREAPLSPEAMGDSYVGKIDEAARDSVSEPVLGPDFFQDRRSQEMFWIVLGLGGFWGLVVLAMILVLLFR